MPSGSAPESVNSSVWQMPVAFSLDHHLEGLRPLELHGLDLKRLSGLEGHGGAHVHRTVLPQSKQSGSGRLP